MKKMQIINIVALIVMLAVNFAANALPLNGKPTGQVSDDVPSLFTPAGYVFAIWGLIYLGLLLYTVYQALPAQRDGEMMRRIGPWFAISSALNTIWLFFWHWELFPLTQVAMVGLLGSLLVLYLRLGIGKRAVSRAEKLLVHVPFSIYLGWISVATIANTAILLYTSQWDRFGFADVGWTILVIVVAAALAIAMTLLRREIAYPLVIVWASAGIVVAHQDNLAVAITAGFCAAVVFIVLVVYRVLGKQMPASSGG